MNVAHVMRGCASDTADRDRICSFIQDHSLHNFCSHCHLRNHTRLGSENNRNRNALSKIDCPGYLELKKTHKKNGQTQKQMAFEGNGRGQTRRRPHLMDIVEMFLKEEDIATTTLPRDLGVRYHPIIEEIAKKERADEEEKL